MLTWVPLPVESVAPRKRKRPITALIAIVCKTLTNKENLQMRIELLALAKKAIAVAIIALYSISHPGLVNAQDSELIDLGSITCKDVLIASGADRDAVILVVHAYLLGEAGQLKYDDAKLGDATDRFLDACVAKPDTQALAMMRERLKTAD